MNTPVENTQVIIYANVRDWVNRLSTSNPKPPIAEAVTQLRVLKTKWDNCVFYPWGDEALSELVMLYEEDQWKSECASYVNECIEDLLDDQNYKSTVWRFHKVLKVIRQSFLSHQSDNDNIKHWQLLATEMIQPKSETEHWVSLLLGAQDQEVFAEKFVQLNALPELSLPTAPEDIQFLCAQLAASNTFAPTTPDYDVLCKRLAVVAYWTWLNRSVDDLKKPLTLQLLKDAETNSLLSWYCLGMINPRTHPVASSDREYYAAVSQHFEKFIKDKASWFAQQADIILDAYIEVTQILRDRMGIERYAWLETWMLEVRYAESPDARVNLLQLVDEKAVLWWLKPKWQQHAALFESLQLDSIEIIAQCRAKDAQQSRLSSIDLPNSLSL